MKGFQRLRFEHAAFFAPYKGRLSRSRGKRLYGTDLQRKRPVQQPPLPAVFGVRWQRRCPTRSSRRELDHQRFFCCWAASSKEDGNIS